MRRAKQIIAVAAVVVFGTLSAAGVASASDDDGDSRGDNDGDHSDYRDDDNGLLGLELNLEDTLGSVGELVDDLL